MYHVALQTEAKPKINYSNLCKPEEKERIEIPLDDSVPSAPDGFVFYRVQSGDTLVSLSVRFGISQNKIRRYNNKVCFGHRLTHIVGKLLLIPVQSTANLTDEIKQQLNKIYIEDDNQRTKYDENLDERKFAEPDENGKYQLKKALMFHAKGIDEHRAAYYLGEANWNVRKALNLWRDDDKWEKRRQIMNACKLNEDEAEQLLDNYHWNVSEAILFWQKEQKKMEKIAKKLQKQAENNNDTEGKKSKLITGSTEMHIIQSNKTECIVSADNNNNNDEEEEHNNINQGSLTGGLCCQ